MITIVTPNLNNGKYLEANIVAIMKLSISFEHIVVDGGSSDNSVEIISRYPHVRLLYQSEKTGMYGAIHEGFLSAKGEYLTWVNSDDRIVPSGFEDMYEKISQEASDFVYSDGYYVSSGNGRNQFGKGRRFGKFFVRHGCMPAIQPSIIFSKKLYHAVGGFRYDKFKICGDLDLFVRMARKKEVRFKYVHAASSLFMKREDSLGNLNNDIYVKELAENGLPAPDLLIRILYRIFKYV